MKFSFEEWRAAGKNIRDVDRMAQLGYQIYLKFLGEQEEAPDEAWTKANVTAFARLLDLAFVHMRLKVRREVRKHMWWRGRFFEPALWENPLYQLHPHAIIEKSLTRGERPTLSELLIMAHDIEAYVRPNLLRLLWVAQISDGSEKPYASAVLKASGEQRSIRHALDNLRAWVRSKSSNVLPKDERRALRELVMSLKSTARDQINLDDLRNWVDHREFLLERDHVLLHFHRSRGSRKPRRITLPREEITAMRRKLLGLVSLLKSFEWMFRYHDWAPARRRRPVRRRS